MIFVLEQAKQPARLVKAVRQCIDLGLMSEFKMKTLTPIEVRLLSESAFLAKTSALDPLLSLPVLTNEQGIDPVSASVRFDEFYRLVAGKSYFQGSYGEDGELPSGQALSIGESGAELKFLRQGRSVAIRNELKSTVGSAVTSDYPVQALAAVSAEDLGGLVTVASIPNLQLGVVNLSDGGPIPDATAINLHYTTIKHVLVKVSDGRGNNAYLASVELLDYLDANAV